MFRELCFAITRESEFLARATLRCAFQSLTFFFSHVVLAIFVLKILLPLCHTEYFAEK